MHNTTKAVCPFCRNHIQANGRIMKTMNVTYDSELLSLILSRDVNYLVCPVCGEGFYYEHNCGVINSHKNYSVISIPATKAPPNPVRASLPQILGKNDFRLRYVREFIFLVEKIRIFEFNLDDRVIEVIKYIYVAKPTGLDTGSKIILTGSDGNALIFTVYDGYDMPLSSHRVSIEAYYRINRYFSTEITDSPNLHWRRVDLEWAKQYSKENIKL